MSAVALFLLFSGLSEAAPETGHTLYFQRQGQELKHSLPVTYLPLPASPPSWDFPTPFTESQTYGKQGSSSSQKWEGACTEDWCSVSGYKKPDRVCIVEDPNAPFVFEGVGPKVGSLGHLELTTSQVKKEAKVSNSILEGILRKVGFAERRQQRQAMSLSELARELAMAAALSLMTLTCFFFEVAHFYFLANPIFGFLCFPLHCCMCFSAICFYNVCGYSLEDFEPAEEQAEADAEEA